MTNIPEKEVKSNRAWREECEALRQQVKDLQEACVNHAQIETALGDELATLKQQMEKHSSNTANMLRELSKLYETFGIILTT